MKMLTFSAILLTISLVNCAASSYKYSAKNMNTTEGDSNVVTLSNAGALCAYKPNSKIMVLKYYPLSKSCAPSSLYSWKLNGMEISSNGNKIIVNSYSLYKKIHSQIATADCAGAGVKVKKILTPTTNTVLYWGNTKMGIISPNQDMKCFKKVNGRYVKIEPIQ